MTALITSIMIMLGFVHSSAPAPQQSAVKPAPPAETTTYHSEPLKLDYTYPATFKNLNEATDAAIQEQKDKATGVAKQAAECVTVPVTALDVTQGFRMLFIMRLDENCLGEETPAEQLGQATTAVLSKSLEQFGEPKLGTSADYDLAGHSASIVSGTVAAEKLAPGKIMFTSATCAIVGKNLTCWEFIADDCKQLSTLAAYPVTFEGKPATQVIPDKLTAACK